MSRHKTESVIGFKAELLDSTSPNVKLVLLCHGNEERSFEVEPLFALGIIAELAKVSRVAQQVSMATGGE